MHPLIAAFPSWYFYKGLLRTGLHLDDCPPLNGPLDLGSLAFIHVEAREMGESGPRGICGIAEFRVTLFRVPSLAELARNYIGLYRIAWKFQALFLHSILSQTFFLLAKKTILVISSPFPS